MHATLRRYEGVDQSRTDELKRKVTETLVPRLSELPGFNGYYLIEADNSIMTSIDLFETSTQASDSTRFAAEWIWDKKLESVLPDPPKVTLTAMSSRMRPTASASGISVAEGPLRFFIPQMAREAGPFSFSVSRFDPG